MLTERLEHRFCQDLEPALDETDRIRIHAAKQSGQKAALFVNFQSQHRWWLQLA